MSFPLDVKYCNADIVKLVSAIAVVWKSAATEVPGLDVGKLFASLEAMTAEWRKAEEQEAVDKDFQALLALAAASPWFSADQQTKIDEWLEEVATSGPAEDWMASFKEEDLKKVVLESLKAKSIQEVTVDQHGKAILVEYIGGNYGEGKHNGCVCLNDEELRLYDHREPGKYLTWTSDLPSDTDELGKCLKGYSWEAGWEEG
mmetsp:Transcript_17944/g.41863  ORF Transcript_17944/g.41863 Transcript_17944/m.41863 type:complete len:202 (+) Transcript_17944:110-715(+)